MIAGLNPVSRAQKHQTFAGSRFVAIGILQSVFETGGKVTTGPGAIHVNSATGVNADLS